MSLLSMPKPTTTDHGGGGPRGTNKGTWKIKFASTCRPNISGKCRSLSMFHS